MRTTIGNFRKLLRQRFMSEAGRVDRERRGKYGYDNEDDGTGVNYGDLPESVVNEMDPGTFDGPADSFSGHGPSTGGPGPKAGIEYYKKMKSSGASEEELEAVKNTLLAFGVKPEDLPEDVDRLRRASDGYGETEFEESKELEESFKVPSLKEVFKNGPFALKK